VPQAARRSSETAQDIAPEDLVRAQLYSLLARFLAVPPTSADLAGAATLEGNPTQLGKAISTLARVSAHTTPAEAASEYHDLLIGLGRGELVPYGSYYLTGFLHEKPLAKLRQDMARLGITRNPAVGEPEDHIASLLETMAGLIEGRFGAPAPLDQQKSFFNTHIEPWALHFFRDLEAAKASRFYVAIAAIGRTFLEIETKAYDMA
jgi:TorA maturation chaperone TorD